MTTFKTSLRIVIANWRMLLVYLVLLGGVGAALGLAQAPTTSQDLNEQRSTVAVVDRDHSPISEGLAAYLGIVGDLQPIEDTQLALENATAQNRISYIVIVPAGFGDALREAARNGREAPRVATLVSYDYAAGAILGIRTESYLRQVAGYIATVADDPATAAQLAGENVAQGATAEVLPAKVAALPVTLRVYAQFITYPLVVFCMLAVATLMAATNKPALRARTTASPEPEFSRGLGLLGACLVAGIVGWLWLCVLGLVCFGRGTAAAAPQLAVMAAALFAYMLVGIALGFLLGRARVGIAAATALANFFALVLSFLGGTFVPLEYAPDVVAIARLTPCYWANEAITGAFEATSTTLSALGAPLAQCGLCALFAVALASAGLLLGRRAE